MPENAYLLKKKQKKKRKKKKHFFHSSHIILSITESPDQLALFIYLFIYLKGNMHNNWFKIFMRCFLGLAFFNCNRVSWLEPGLQKKKKPQQKNGREISLFWKKLNHSNPIYLLSQIRLFCLNFRSVCVCKVLLDRLKSRWATCECCIKRPGFSPLVDLSRSWQYRSTLIVYRLGSYCGTI